MLSGSGGIVQCKGGPVGCWIFPMMKREGTANMRTTFLVHSGHHPLNHVIHAHLQRTHGPPRMPAQPALPLPHRTSWDRSSRWAFLSRRRVLLFPKLPGEFTSPLPWKACLLGPPRLHPLRALHLEAQPHLHHTHAVRRRDRKNASSSGSSAWSGSSLARLLASRSCRSRQISYLLRHLRLG